MATSYSETQAFKTCQKMHEWQYTKGIRPIEKADALYFGSAIHSALEELYKDMPLDAALSVLDELDDTNRAKARALISHYFAQYMASQWNPDCVLDVEKWVKCSFGGHAYIGRLDAVISIDGKTWIVEHKTATSVDEGYVERVKIDTQSMLYILAAREEYGEVEGVIYDVLIKPAIRIKKSETLEAFEARCIEDVTAENFVRVLQRFSDEDLEEAKQEFMACCQAIKDCEYGMVKPYRNTGACNAIGRPCPYLCLCCERKPARLAELIEAKFSVKESDS